MRVVIVGAGIGGPRRRRCLSEIRPIEAALRKHEVPAPPAHHGSRSQLLAKRKRSSNSTRPPGKHSETGSWVAKPGRLLLLCPTCGMLRAAVAESDLPLCSLPVVSRRG